MHPLFSRLLLLLCLPMGWGCAAMGTLQTADTLGAGKTRWSAQLMAQATPSAAPLPQAAVGLQYGLTDSLDVGARVSTVGLELSGKVRLVGAEDSPWVVSLAPAVGLHQPVPRFDAYWAYNEQRYATLPVLVGMKVGEGSQLVTGLRPTWLYFPQVDGPGERRPAESGFALGASVGYAFRVGSRVRLMPELAVQLPLGPQPSALEVRSEGTKPHLQLGLALMLDTGSEE